MAWKRNEVKGRKGERKRDGATTRKQNEEKKKRDGWGREEGG